METRLIIAYSLIAIMALCAIFGVVMIRRKLAHNRRRDHGNGGD